MDRAARARMQARIVLVVYRVEMTRLALLDVSTSDRVEWEDALRQRSIALLDQAVSRLDEEGGAHRATRRELSSVRAEITGPIA